MNFEEKAIETAKIASIKMAEVRTWSSKIDALSKRKDSPMRENEFCQKYGISPARFNRYKKMREPSIPTDAFIDTVKAAFKSESV